MGEVFTSAIEQRLAEIESNPWRFGPLEYPPELATKVRRAVVKRFRYVIAYMVQQDEVVVLAIYHAHREPGYWRGRIDD